MAASPKQGNRGDVQSVARAFALLEHVSRLEFASVGQLSEAVGLPKPTVVRMMRTLIAGGTLHQSAARADYRLTSKLALLAGGAAGLDALMDNAARIADALTEQIWWPVAICQRRGEHMIVRYSTIPTSPYSHARSTVGKRLPLWTSAHGKAWLAHAPRDRERMPEVLEEELQRVRVDGFATRTYGRDPSTNSLAVPIRVQGRVAATIGVTFFSRALDASGVGRLSERVAQSARQIEDATGRATAFHDAE